MQQTPLRHLIRWGLYGAATATIPVLLVYVSDLRSFGDILIGAAFMTPLVVGLGVAAGMLTYYVWNTGASPLAYSLGVVGCLTSLFELLIGAFLGPAGLSGLLFAPFDIRYPSLWQLIGGAVVAGLLYQAALLAALLVIRQLFRWVNALAARYRRSR